MQPVAPPTPPVTPPVTPIAPPPTAPPVAPPASGMQPSGVPPITTSTPPQPATPALPTDPVSVAGQANLRQRMGIVLGRDPTDAELHRAFTSKPAGFDWEKFDPAWDAYITSITGEGGTANPDGSMHRPFDPIITEGENLATPFDPIDDGGPTMESNLRGNVYTPGGDPRLTGAQGRTDAAAAAIASAPGYGNRFRSITGEGRNFLTSTLGLGDIEAGAVNPNVSGRNVNTQVAGGPDVDANDPGKYAGEQDAALAALGGPNRTELAQQALADFDLQGEQNLQNRFRRVGQSAAKFGRLGMGDVNAELGSIQGDFERDRMLRENELARSVAEGDIDDRFRRVSTTAGLRGQESDISSGLRGEQRIERGYDTDLDERNVARDLADRDFETGLDERNVGRQFDDRNFTTGLGERNYDRTMGRENYVNSRAAQEIEGDDADRYDRLGAARTLEDSIFGQGQSNRGEMRTERGYQQGAAQQSLDNRINERAIAEQERSNRLTRAIALMRAGGEVPEFDTLLNA